MPASHAASTAARATSAAEGLKSPPIAAAPKPSSVTLSPVRPTCRRFTDKSRSEQRGTQASTFHATRQHPQTTKHQMYPTPHDRGMRASPPQVPPADLG